MLKVVLMSRWSEVASKPMSIVHSRMLASMVRETSTRSIVLATPLWPPSGILVMVSGSSIWVR